MNRFFIFTLCCYSFIYAENMEQEKNHFFENINFDYSIYMNSYKYSKIDNKVYDKSEFWNKLNVKNQNDLNDNLILNTNFLLMFSSSNDTYQGVFTELNENDNSPKYFDIEELYFTYYSDSTDYYFGKKIKKIGLSEIYSPTNIFSQSISTPPQHITEVGPLNFGLDYYTENDNTVSFHVFPFNTKYGGEDDNGRWLRGSGDSDFNNLGNGVTTDMISDEAESSKASDWGYLLQYTGIIESVDYYSFIARKKSSFPILIQKSLTKYDKVNPLSNYLAFGLMKVIKERKYYLDIIYQNTDDNLDQDYIKYNLGFKHRETDSLSSFGLDEISLILEYSGEKIIDKKVDTTTYKTSESSRINKNNLIANINIIKDSHLSLIYGINYSIDEYDSLQNLTIEYKYDDNTKLYLSKYTYKGRPDTHFGRWNENDNIELGLNYKF